ncbi:MAG TPA: glutamate racemase, partial [Gammaproteobacteria bacterium]|nr:glutamate racemase [Gammaproteobacteria bacterium]
ATVVAAAVGQAALHEQSTRSVDPMQMTQFLATDGVDRFRRVGEYFLGQVLPAVEWVDL